MICLPAKQEIAVRTMLEWTPPNGFRNRLEMTHTCVVALLIADALVSDIKGRVTKFCLACIQPDGSFRDSHFPRSETEGAYSAIRTMNLCGTLKRLPDKTKTIRWVLSKQNPDGGFGAFYGWGESFKNREELLRKEGQSSLSVFPYREDSSAHSSFFAYGALEPLGAVSQIDLQALGRFLMACQNSDGSWGFHPDDQYGNTITTSFSLVLLSRLGMLDSIDKEKVIRWILECQRDDGSFGPYPEFPGTSLLQRLYTARAAKSLRILNALHCMDVWHYEEYWNQFTIRSGWDAVCLGMAVGLPLVLRER